MKRQVLLRSATVLLLLLVASPRVEALSCIRFVSQTLALRLERVVGRLDPRPAPAFVTALVRFDRLFSSRTYQKGRAVTMAVIGFRWGAPQPKRSTTVKWFALSRSTPPSPAVQARLQALAGRTWEVLCGFRVPFLPLAPGIYQFRYDSGDSRQTTPKDLVDPVLTIGPSMKRGRLEFSYRGVRYVAHYAISADITIFPARLTPELRTRGMCLRGFRKFCTKPYRSAPRKP